MQTNEQLCRHAQKGNTAARDLLLMQNQGFIRKTAVQLYQSNNLEESDLYIELDDLMQEGSLGLLKAIPLYDSSKSVKFLTYAAPAIRNAMTDLIRDASRQFEHQLTDKDARIQFSRVYLDDILDGDERLRRIEAIADPYAKMPEQIILKREELQELYAALDALTLREQSYLLYRYGFTDDIEHTLIGTAIHFHLSKSRARQTEEIALDNLWLEFPQSDFPL